MKSNDIILKYEKRGVAQLGSALGSGPRGRWFESSHSDHKKEGASRMLLLFYGRTDW